MKCWEWEAYSDPLIGTALESGAPPEQASDTSNRVTSACAGIPDRQAVGIRL